MPYLLGGQTVDSLKEAFFEISQAASSANFFDAQYQIDPAPSESAVSFSQSSFEIGFQSSSV